MPRKGSSNIPPPPPPPNPSNKAKKTKGGKKGAKNTAHGNNSDSDSSVDSHGNIRNLIDYDYSESECDSDEDMFEMEEAPRTPNAPRKAKLIAQKRLRKIAKETAESKNSTPISKGPRRKRPVLVITSDSESSESESESESEPEEKAKAPTKKRIKPTKVEKKRTKKRTKVVESESEDEDDEEEEEDDDEEEEESADFTTEESESYSEDDDEDEDDEDDDDEDEEDDEDRPRGRRSKGSGAIDIVISDLLGGGGRDPNKPRKYNMKKEPDSVRRFVELVQKENEEEDNIDNDIAYFKSLTGEKQNTLLKVLELKASPAEVTIPIKFKILEKVAAKPDLNRIAMAKYNALCNIDPSSSEYYKVSHWITGFTGIPLGIYKDLPVVMEDGPEKCNEFMTKVHACMDAAIYGHDEAKLQIMQFVSSWIANPKAHGNVLSIHGPMGTGKTTLIKDGVAKALGRPFHFITLGGATDASFLDGHSYTYEGSTWGKIVDVLIQSKCMNPIIYFDELDKVSETPKGDEINNLLIHLTDGSQNDRFQDKYFTGIDLDLSRCLFIFSHNAHEKVNPILRDRMYNIAVKGFNTKEKLTIVDSYLLTSALKESGLHEKVSISKEIMQYVIENFTGGEAGVRELKRCIQTLVSKLNLLRFYNNPKQVPFAIEGFSLPFILKKSHIELFLKKKEGVDESIAHLYT